jgi:hypothetical protein
MHSRNEIEWLRSVLGGTGTGPDEVYLSRPSAAEPHLLIPLASPVVAKAALHRYHDNRTIKERLIGVAAQTVARLGFLERGPGDRVELEPFAMIQQLARVLSEPNLVCAITIGPPRRNRKPVVQLLRPNGETVGFAKVGWSPFTQELISNEGYWLKQVRGKMPKGFVAPDVLFQGPVLSSGGAATDSTVVVTGPLETSPFSRRREPLELGQIAELARCLGSQDEKVSDLPQVQAALESVDQLVSVKALLARHGDVVIETGIWHGDLTPWNTATNLDGLSVWDWEFAGGHRPIGFDAMHIRFETIRRAAVSNEVAAVRAIVAETPDLISGLGQPAEAMIDLYLLELLSREVRLAGEGWEPRNLGPLDEVVAQELNRRLT